MSVSKQAAIELLDRRKAGANEPVLSDSLRPKSIDDALAIQAQMLTLQPVKGWKCLLPPDPEKVVVAPVFKVQNNSPTLALFECENVAMVEPEIAFVLDRDLPARAGEYSEQEIVNAIGSAHMALECIQKRFSKEAYEHFYDALADGLYNQGIYIGPEINKTQAINASAVKIFIEQSSHTLALEGVHPNPRAIDGLLWLINFMNKRGVGLKANEAIITGSFKGIVELAFDEVTTIEYENLGKYHVKFTRAQ